MTDSTLQPGLYVVATPIGNLTDLSPRATDTLKRCTLILCEDTRETGKLCNHYGIVNSLTSYHKFNEQKKQHGIVDQLLQGAAIALVSDSGTPAVSDPGNRLVQVCHRNNIKVCTVPGCSAVSAAVSVSGLCEDGYCFIGFLPAKSGARMTLLAQYRDSPVALVCFEAPHRIADSVDDLIAVFGGEREACFARELTKRFETVKLLSLTELRRLLAAESNQQRGEIVLVIAPASAPADTDSSKLIESLAKAGIRAKQASQVLASMTGKPARQCYQQYLDHDSNNNGENDHAST